MPVYSQKIIIPPKELAVSVNTVKEFLHIDYNDEDKILQILIQAAIKKFESYTGKAIVKQCLQITYFNNNSEKIILPVTPVTELQNIEISSYNGTWNEIDKSMCRIENHQLHMQTFSYYISLRITYDAGMAIKESEVPEDVKIALLKYIGHLYENRGDDINTKTLENVLLEDLYGQFREIRLG